MMGSNTWAEEKMPQRKDYNFFKYLKGRQEDSLSGHTLHPWIPPDCMVPHL